MGFPAKVQLIQRKDSRQWYFNFSLCHCPSHGVSARGNRVVDCGRQEPSTAPSSQGSYRDAKKTKCGKA
jgi:hypothetical protein